MTKAKPQLKEIPVDRLQRGRYQPRRHFAEEELQELAQSIRSSGLIQPIVVRPISGENYEIIAGERRWRAAQLAGLHELSCLVSNYNDEQAAAVSTIENINRVDLNPIEEAQAYRRMILEFNYRHDEMAAIVGKSRVKITNVLRLLKCNKRVQQLLIDGKLSEGHGRALAALPSEEQERWAEHCAARGWSVRRLEREIKASHFSPKEKERGDPDIEILANELGDYLGCHVAVEFNEQHCRLHIDCGNIEIFEGVLERIGFYAKS